MTSQPKGLLEALSKYQKDSKANNSYSSPESFQANPQCSLDSTSANIICLGLQEAKTYLRTALKAKWKNMQPFWR